jgi:hypothetical protein
MRSRVFAADEEKEPSEELECDPEEEGCMSCGEKGGHYPGCLYERSMKSLKPSQVASKLRQIAATIDKSKSPRADLVAEDLNKIIAAIDYDKLPYRDLVTCAEVLRDGANMVKKTADNILSGNVDFDTLFGGSTTVQSVINAFSGVVETLDAFAKAREEWDKKRGK